jgi:hypothetical protein
MAIEVRSARPAESPVVAAVLSAAAAKLVERGQGLWSSAEDEDSRMISSRMPSGSRERRGFASYAWIASPAAHGYALCTRASASGTIATSRWAASCLSDSRWT